MGAGRRGERRHVPVGRSDTTAIGDPGRQPLGAHGGRFTEYDGYTVAPVATDAHRLMFGEFDRTGSLSSSLPSFLDPLKPRRLGLGVRPLRVAADVLELDPQGPTLTDACRRHPSRLLALRHSARTAYTRAPDRHCLGVRPNQRRHDRFNALCSAYPSRPAICERCRSGSAR